jgi:transporter family protein
MAAFLVAAALVLGKTRSIGELSQRALVFIVLSGAAGAASWFFYFLALRDGTATGVAALDRLSVVLVFVLAVLFLGEAFSVKAAVGAVMIVMGAILLT